MGRLNEAGSRQKNQYIKFVSTTLHSHSRTIGLQCCFSVCSSSLSFYYNFQSSFYSNLLFSAKNVSSFVHFSIAHFFVLPPYSPALMTPSTQGIVIYFITQVTKRQVTPSLFSPRDNNDYDDFVKIVDEHFPRFVKIYRCIEVMSKDISDVSFNMDEELTVTVELSDDNKVNELLENITNVIHTRGYDDIEPVIDGQSVIIIAYKR